MSDLRGFVAHEDGKTVLGATQDCEPFLERAAALRSEGRYGGADMKHAASLPMVIVEKYLNDNNIDLREFLLDPVHIKRVANHPDNSLFRIWPGRL